MYARNWLIKLCEKKQELVGPKHKYFTQEDREEIMSWPTATCIAIRKQIEYTLYYHAHLDGDICPWCIIYGACQECTYGFRHGMCFMSADSTWKTIRKEMGDICELPGFRDIAKYLLAQNYI